MFASAYKVLWFAIVFAALVMSGQSSVGAQGTASLYITPSTAVLEQGSSFQVTVYANSPNEPLVVAEISLTYPESLLTFIGFDASDSAFDIDVPRASGSNGKITMVRASAAGQTGDAIKVVTISFKANMTSGNAELAFAGGDNQLLTASDNILSSTTGGVYSIASKDNDSQAPTPTAPEPNTIPRDGASSLLPPDALPQEGEEPTNVEDTPEDSLLEEDLNAETEDSSAGLIYPVFGENASASRIGFVIAGVALVVLVGGFAVMRIVSSRKMNSQNRNVATIPAAQSTSAGEPPRDVSQTKVQVDTLLSEVHPSINPATEGDALGGVEIKPQQDTSSVTNNKNS